MIISICGSVMHVGEDAYGNAYGRRWQSIDPVSCTAENKFELYNTKCFIMDSNHIFPLLQGENITLSS